MLSTSAVGVLENRGDDVEDLAETRVEERAHEPRRDPQHALRGPRHLTAPVFLQRALDRVPLQIWSGFL